MKRVLLILFYAVYANHLQAKQNELDIFMAGDALLHKAVYEDARQENSTYDFSVMLNALKPIVAQYDLAFYNQESILGGSALGLSTYPTFNSPQEFGDNMLSLGFNLVSIANNHTLDRGLKAVRASLAYWKDKPALTAGSYDSLEDRNTPRILEKNGIKYALLAYTYGTNGIPLPKGKEYLVNIYTLAMLKQDIQSIRTQVDFLIISMHWGIEYAFEPSLEQRKLAKTLANLGADLIIGTHPHVVQPIEWIGDSLVYYSLGNLISAQKGTNKRIGLLGGVHVSKIKEGKVKLSNPRAELIYTYYDKHTKNFKLMWFHELNNMILPSFQAIYNQYMQIATKSQNPEYNQNRSETQKQIRVGIQN